MHADTTVNDLTLYPVRIYTVRSLHKSCLLMQQCTQADFVYSSWIMLTYTTVYPSRLCLLVMNHAYLCNSVPKQILFTRHKSCLLMQQCTQADFVYSSWIMLTYATMYPSRLCLLVINHAYLCNSVPKQILFTRHKSCLLMQQCTQADFVYSS